MLFRSKKNRNNQKNDWIYPSDYKQQIELNLIVNSLFSYPEDLELITKPSLSRKSDTNVQFLQWL